MKGIQKTKKDTWEGEREKEMSTYFGILESKASKTLHVLVNRTSQSNVIVEL